MKKLFLVSAVLFTTSALAEDIRIVDVQPRYSTYFETRCHTEQVATNNSGVGTVIGAVTGGIVGHQVGRGTGKDVATVLGAVVGAGVGQRIGQDQQNVETRQICNQVPVTQQKGETVRFSYKGKVYSFVTE